MKNLIFINGTMGVGKTKTSRELQKLLPRCAFLDGDWCWDMSPFTVTDETKAMVEDNICHVLSNFLKCSEFDNIIFCWVMHQQAIMDSLLSRLDTCGSKVYRFSLICSEEALKQRLHNDVVNGVRDSDAIARSLPRLGNYLEMDTEKIDTTGISPKQAAQVMLRIISPE
ncbi:MAG: AAA family ATPase [Firmicutes bacterium]|nr:AAA family ATPase [Bacillota bacterium]